MQGYNNRPISPERAFAELPPNLRINAPFRVLYDLRWMTLGQAGGVEQATYELISAISRLDRKNSYHVFAPRSACWEWDFPERFQATRHYSDEGAVAAKIEAELVHSTCSFIQPEMLDRPSVLTIHDLQHLHHPEFFTPADLAERDRLYRVSAENARHIICISEFTRRDVHERFGIPLERMTTIWNIPSESAWRELPRATSARLLRRMGISGPFLFYPAQGWPHKNHLRLMQAMELASGELPRDLKLVLTGRPLANDHPAAALLREQPYASRVMHLGYRSSLEVRALLQGCTALIFPSLFEGFGMPVAEAIVAGKPIACSNVTSLPEIAGDAAVMFEPTDVDQIAIAVSRVVRDAALRDSLVNAARARRALFSARMSALKSMAVYEMAMAA